MVSLMSSNHFHLQVQGQREKLLPVQLRILEADLLWANDNKKTILDDLCKVIQNNLEFIEKKSHIDIKSAQYSRLSGSKLISVTVATVRDTQRKYDLITFDNKTGNANSASLASFSLKVWLFPFNSSNPYGPLPIED